MTRCLSILLAVILSGLLSANPSFAATSSWGGKSAYTDFSSTGLLAHNNPVNRIDPSGNVDFTLGGLMSGMTIRGYLAGVVASYASGKAIDASFQLYFIGNLSELQIYNHWNLLNLIPGAVINKGFNSVARYWRGLNLTRKHKSAIISAHKQTPKAANGIPDCDLVSDALVKKFDDAFGKGAVNRPITSPGLNHNVVDFDGVVYDLSAGRYAKYLKNLDGAKLEKFVVAINTGVFDPALVNDNYSSPQCQLKLTSLPVMAFR